MRLALVAGMSVSLMSCIDEVTAGDSTIRGTYTLRTVNGAGLPYTKSNVGTTKVELLEDKISLFMGGTFSQTIVTRTTVGGQASEQTATIPGTYGAGFNNSVVITPNGGTSRTVIIENGNTMTYSEVGANYVWRK